MQAPGPIIGGPVTARSLVRRYMLAICAAVLATIVLVQIFHLYVQHRAIVEREQRRAENVAAILAEQLRQTGVAIAASLNEIAGRGVTLSAEGAGDEDWSRMLTGVAAGVTAIGSLSVLSADGVVRHSTIPALVGQSLTQSAFVGALMGDPAASVRIGQPAESPVTRRSVIPFGVRIVGRDGRLRGIALATLAPDYLRAIYRTIDVGPGGVIGLVDPAGRVVLSEPERSDDRVAAIGAGPLRQALGDGRATGWIALDADFGDPAFAVGYAAVPGLPIVVAIAVSMEEDLAGRLRGAAVDVVITILVALALVFATRQLLASLRSREQAGRDLERRESELHIAQLVARVGSAVIGPDGRAAHPSAMMLELLGRDPAHRDLTVDDMVAAVEPADREPVADAIRRCAVSGEAFAFEFKLRPVGAEPPRTIRGEGHGYLPADGAPAAIVVWQDVTERSVLAEKLSRAQRLEAVGLLTGGIAHDFNNLLTVIIGSTEMLLNAVAGNAMSKELAELARDAARRGADLTSRLLAFSRRQTLRPQDIDVRELIGQMQGLLRRTLGEHIQIQTLHADGLWPAKIDASQLEVALLNLAVNARDAMPAGGRLLFETSNVVIDRSYADRNTEVAPGCYVLIAVSDSGTGMSADVMAHVFEPFFTTKDVGKGTGLGLSMVFGFVKQSAGHVSIYSEPGMGTTVKLYLPRGLAVADAPDATVQAEPPRGTETVLVVEDDELVRRLAERVLWELGYRTIVVASGREALGLLQGDATVDLVFADMIMPGGMNGLQVIEAARRMRPGLPVILTSGYTVGALTQAQTLDAAIIFLQKPYRREDLARALRRALDDRPGPADGGA